VGGGHRSGFGLLCGLWISMVTSTAMADSMIVETNNRAHCHKLLMVPIEIVITAGEEAGALPLRCLPAFSIGKDVLADGHLA
jgi:hypothetical protein